MADAWSSHVSAAVSEGYCPDRCGPLQPVDSLARSAGWCSRCGWYWWTGGPETEWRECGGTSELARVP